MVVGPGLVGQSNRSKFDFVRGAAEQWARLMLSKPLKTVHLVRPLHTNQLFFNGFSKVFKEHFGCSEGLRDRVNTASARLEVKEAAQSVGAVNLQTIMNA